VSTVVDQPGAEVGDHARAFSPPWISGPRLRLVALALPGVAALVAWRASLLHVNVSHLNDYGLPPVLPIAWYLALLVAVVGSVTAATARRTNTLIMVGYLIVVVFILYGTVPVLSGQPHYAWVYKHIGVVRYLEVHGQVTPSIDIYNRWPGFFAFGALFSQVVGRPNPESYAGWAELFFILMDGVAVMAAVKLITKEARIAAIAALLFVLTNWVGQTYYSPQAFAFFLGLVLIIVILRQLRGTNYSPRLTRLVERVGHRKQLPIEREDIPKWPRGAAIAFVLGLDAVIVASHQLTPYILLGSIALLALSGVFRPWWLLGAMAAITFAYLAVNFHFIQHNYGLFSSIDPFNNLYIKKYTEAPTAGKVFNTNVEYVLIALVWLSGIAAAVRLLRRGLLIRALPFVVLAAAPFAIIFGQSYGGEASLRIILFSSPWTGALVAWGLATVKRPRVRWALTATAAVVFASLFVPSFLGQEELNIISPGEVAASEWFYSHARRRSVLLLAAPGFPYRYGATYPDYNGPEGDANPNLLADPNFQGRQLGPASLRGVIYRITLYSEYGYVSFTNDETAYAETLGITPRGALRNLEVAMARSPDFRLVYGNRDARIYELVGGKADLGTASRALLSGASRGRSPAPPIRVTGKRAGLSARRVAPQRKRSRHGIRRRAAAQLPPISP
jgi:hypothetical protein